MEALGLPDAERFEFDAAARGRPSDPAAPAGGALPINARQFAADRAVMERHLAGVKTTTAESPWEASRRRGRSLPVEEAVAFALEG